MGLLWHRQQKVLCEQPQRILCEQPEKKMGLALLLALETNTNADEYTAGNTSVCIACKYVGILVCRCDKQITGNVPDSC